MYNPESVQEKETHKFPWDFEMQSDQLILARQPDIVIVNKKRQHTKWWTSLFIAIAPRPALPRCGSI